MDGIFARINSVSFTVLILGFSFKAFIISSPKSVIRSFIGSFIGSFIESFIESFVE